MGEVTIRLSEELQAFVDDGVEGGDYPDAEAYIQALLEHENARRTARLHELLEEGLATGISEKTVDQIFDEAKRRARNRRAAGA